MRLCDVCQKPWPVQDLTEVQLSAAGDGEVWYPTYGLVCPECMGLAEEEEPKKSRKLTRMEKLQAAADAGVDTWEEYRGER